MITGQVVNEMLFRINVWLKKWILESQICIEDDTCKNTQPELMLA